MDDKIGIYAFCGYSSITQVSLTNGLTILGDNMFDMFTGNVSLPMIIIPSTITFMGQ